MRQTLDVIRSEPHEDLLDIELETVPLAPFERMIAALGERADADAASRLYRKFLCGYSGSDFPILHFAQRQAIRFLLDPQEDKGPHLSMIERSYARGVMVDRSITRLRQAPFTAPTFSTHVADHIASHPDRFPMELVGLSEAVCKEIVSAQVVPVGVIAQRDNWFPE